MISSNDAELVSLARQMSAWGRGCFCVGAANLLPNGVCGKRFSCWLPSCPDIEVDHKYVYGTDRAYNLQPLDLQGALGCVQMGKLAAIHEARRGAFNRLNAMVIRHLKVLPILPLSQAEPSWFGYPIICPSYAYKRALVAHLEAAGVQTRNYFAGTITAQPGYSHLGHPEDQPNAAQVLRRVFFLGCNPGWQDAHFAHIEATLKAFTPPPSS